KTLREALKRIADPSIRSHYGEEIKRLRWDLFGTKPRTFTPRRKGPYIPEPQNAMTATKGSLLAQGAGPIEETLREAVILATLITHPSLITRFQTALERIDFTGPDHDTLRRLILSHADAPNLPAEIHAHAPTALDALMAQPHVAISPAVRNAADPDLATLCLAEELAKLDARRGARREIEDAVDDMNHLPDEGLTWRLAKASEARHRADRPAKAETADLGEDRAALSNHLQNLIDGRVWEKKNR
ncbi:MAG: DNA primase, partial [Paracoccaceae bacterium]